jgi:hypothetical protein
MIAVMQAAVDGKQIEWREALSRQGWRPATEPWWNWSEFEYRVKPEPREWWIVSGKGGPWTFMTLCDAKRFTISSDYEIIHVREVLP